LWVFKKLNNILKKGELSPFLLI
jgi:hypothetical protein